MSWHGMSAWVVFGLSTLPFLTMRVLQVRFHDDIDGSSLARAIYICVHGPPAFTLWFRVSHTQQAARARFPNQKMVRNQVCCFHGVVLWHGTWCSNVRDVALLAPTETHRSFTAFSSISTEEGRQKQTTASDFPAVQKTTNDRQKRLVTARRCFSQCWVVTWNVVLISLCTWAVGVMNEVWHFSSSNKKTRKFHGVQCSVKKADKSKPLHPNFRLFSKQPTTDKKGW